MKKRILALLCALGLITACPACAAQGKGPEEDEVSSGAWVETLYEDVVGDEWFAPAVAEVTRLGLMSGVEGGGFAPYREVNRATIVLVLWRMEGSPEAEMDDPFPDTEEWYADAANWAKSVGIASGYGGVDPDHPAGSFGGRDSLTREQLAVFLYNYAKYKDEPIAEGMLGLYSDAFQISDWAETAVRHAVGMGILQGGDGGALDPKGVANRAALAVMLHRMMTPAAG